jgi:hypothetical protein
MEARALKGVEMRLGVHGIHNAREAEEADAARR